MNLSEIFARNLRVRMATLSFKTSDLYKMTGTSKTTIMALEYGKNKGAMFETIGKLAVALECKPEDFFKLNCEWTSKAHTNNWKNEVVKYE